MTVTGSPLGATEYATSSDGTRIAYARGGSGPVLVLVDGAFCYREFGPSERVPQALADRFTVVAWDRRGRGESGAGASTYAPEREFEDLAAVVAATGGEIVLGFSSGAALAYRTAAAGLIAPRALVGYEAPFVGRNSGKDGRPRDYRGDLEKLLAAGRNDKAVDYFMVTMVNGPAFLPLMMRLMRGPFAKLKAVAPTLLHDTDLMAGFEVPTAELARIAVPTLVLCGGKAAPAMAEAQEAIAAAIPGAEHAVLPGQMHDVKPEALREGILPFLAARGLTPAPAVAGA
ncbi:MAG: alpha/beta hydrolase [Actinomycetales bacterium]|nr:alpha/beta hydrolase [Actinomycetales bacterium]